MQVSLTRIIIFGRDIDLLKDFYAGSFNLDIIEEIAGEWVVLNAGAIELALHKIGDAYPPDDAKALSNIKLVFQADTDLHQFRQALLDNGTAMKAVRSFPGIHSLFCDGEDPEGNIFQLEQRLSPLP